MSKRVSFKNESGFKGYWLQFTDNRGVEYRAEHRGGGVYSVYVSNGEAFVHDAIVDVGTKVKKRDLPRAIWDRYTDLLFQQVGEDD